MLKIVQYLANESLFKLVPEFFWNALVVTDSVLAFWCDSVPGYLVYFLPQMESAISPKSSTFFY